MTSIPLFPFAALPPPPPKEKKPQKPQRLRKQNELTPCSQGWQIGVTETECIVWEPFLLRKTVGEGGGLKTEGTVFPNTDQP